MSFAQEQCPTCGVLPDWHLVVRRVVVQRIEAAQAAGTDWDREDPTTALRFVYRHQPGKKCSRFNKAYRFAALSTKEREEAA